MIERKPWKCIDALTLKVMAMAFMLLDHMWATVLPGAQWCTMVGRLAFPIFCFQIVEGFYQTSNRKRYIQRMLVFALLSEIPFNLMASDNLVFPIHQNVMFTFLIALLLMSWMERYRNQLWKFVAVSVVCSAVGYIVGNFTFVDYYGFGVLMVLVFYWTHDLRFGWVLQLAGLLLINNAMAGISFIIPLFGHQFELPMQMIAVLALIPIWMYNGKQGYHSKPLQYACYAFYPVHMCVLYIIRILFIW